MQQTSGEPAADAIQDLFQRLKEFGRGASFKDDVTVVVIRMPAAAG
jgi:serine phosphatase RsbU (regulator of sigma subunit)